MSTANVKTWHLVLALVFLAIAVAITAALGTGAFAADQEPLPPADPAPAQAHPATGLTAPVLRPCGQRGSSTVVWQGRHPDGTPPADLSVFLAGSVNHLIDGHDHDVYTGLIAVEHHGVWQLDPGRLAVGIAGDRNGKISYRYELTCDHKGEKHNHTHAYPIDQRMTRADVEGAPFSAHNAAGTAWVFRHSQPEAYRNIELDILTNVTGVFNPYLVQQQADIAQDVPGAAQKYVDLATFYGEGQDRGQETPPRQEGRLLRKGRACGPAPRRRPGRGDRHQDQVGKRPGADRSMGAHPADGQLRHQQPDHPGWKVPLTASRERAP